MSQRDIIDIIKNNPNKYYDIDTLSNILGINKSSISENISKLEKIKTKSILIKDTHQIIKGIPRLKRLIKWSGEQKKLS